MWLKVNKKKGGDGDKPDDIPFEHLYFVPKAHANSTIGLRRLEEEVRLDIEKFMEGKIEARKNIQKGKEHDEKWNAL